MKKLRYAIVVGAMVASGLYLFVYLYRWEWHRAVIAGVLFLMAEVALMGSAILDRLRSIERRLDTSQGGAGDPPGKPAASSDDILARLEDSAPEPKVNFEWLSRPGGTSVFVPVLLGAGVVLSGVAWVVERLARLTARPALERGLSLQLSRFSLPAGALWGASPPAPARRRSLAPHVAAAAVALVLGSVGVDWLGDLTQDRPDVVLADRESSVVISASAKGPARSSVEATQALWGACTTQLGAGFQVLSMAEAGPGAVEVVVRPQIGRYAERRLRGCIADGSADRLGAHVRSVRPVDR
ncbi:MAG: hypothetical protein M3396_06215 [Actinomycetota bacterium]|nr:hypothetical protein [Actinomycetota bacterium]